MKAVIDHIAKGGKIVFDRRRRGKSVMAAVKYYLLRDYKRDVWILKDFWTNETILVSRTPSRLNRYVNMKNKLKENQERLAHIEWVKQGGF